MTECNWGCKLLVTGAGFGAEYGLVKIIIVPLESVSLRAIRQHEMEVKPNIEVKYLGITLGEKLLRKTHVLFISRTPTRTLKWSIAGKNWGAF